MNITVGKLTKFATDNVETILCEIASFGMKITTKKRQFSQKSVKIFPRLMTSSWRHNDNQKNFSHSLMHIPILYLQGVGLEFTLSIMVLELTSAQNGYKMTQKLSVVCIYLSMYLCIYLSRNSELLYSSPAKKSQFISKLIRLYSKPVVIGEKFNGESFKKVPETLQSFLYPL